MPDHLAAAQRDLDLAMQCICHAQDHLAALAPPVITDREPRPIPPLVAPVRGEVITDPVFGRRLLRITGPANAGVPEPSFRTPDSSVQRAWNATATRFVVEDTYGQQHVYDFEARTLRAQRRRILRQGDVVAFTGADSSWHDTDPDLLFGRYGNKVLKCCNVATGDWTTILDLDTLGLNLPEESYTGGVYVQSNKLLTVCGGATNDDHHWVVYLDLATGTEITLDTRRLTQFNQGQGFTLHGSVLDLSAQYVLMQPAQKSGDTTHLYIWEPTNGAIRQVATCVSGHFSVGRGHWVTQDVASGPWDAAQWGWRSFSTPDQVTNCIDPVLTPKEIYLADHSCWTNMRTLDDPFCSATYRHVADPCPWRAWDEEVLVIHPLSGVVERHAHHRSSVLTETGAFDYWATPRPNVSPNGRFALFTSNWGRSLGTDVEHNARQDVFLVELR